MSKPLHKALDECLAALEDQPDGLQAGLDSHAEHQAELTGLLELASDLSSLHTITARPGFREHAAQRLIARLPDLAAAPARQKPWFLPARFAQRGWRLAQAALALVLLFIMAATGTVYAADSAGPGDRLYGLDQTLERWQLLFTTDDQAAARLRLDHASERLEEAQSKFHTGETEKAVTALDAYSTEMETLTQWLADTQAQDQVALQELVTAAQATHRDVLLNLPERVPDPARAAIQRAIEAGQPAGGPGGPPTDPGPPDDVPAGRPEEPAAGEQNDLPEQALPETPEEQLDDPPEELESPAETEQPEQAPPDPPEEPPGDQPPEDEAPEQPGRPGPAWLKISPGKPGKPGKPAKHP